MGRLVVVTGVGTDVGKTRISVAMVQRAARSGLRVAGYKPIESGLAAGGGDAAELLEVSTFHVKPAPLYGFSAPISPHLAAEREGRAIDLGAIASATSGARAACDLVVLELAGGLFSLLGPADDNASLVLRLEPDAVVLVAVDALGVLHHARASAIAGGARGLPAQHLALVTPELPDASTGANAPYLEASFASVQLVPRVARADLAECEAVGRLVRDILGGSPCSALGRDQRGLE